MDLTYVDGMSSRGTVGETKEMGLTTGKLFYVGNRVKCSAATSPNKAMPLHNPDEPGDKAMGQAFAQALQYNRNLAPLYDWASSVETVNQKTARAFYTGLLQAPLSTFENAKIVSEGLRTTKRLGLHKPFAETCMHMKPRLTGLCVRPSHITATPNRVQRLGGLALAALRI